MGRKQFDGKDQKLILQKLEEAFSYSFTDEEAALYAGISTTALYEFIKKTKGFRERKEQLKKHPNLAAKRNLIQSIQRGSVDNSRWWLERRCKLEFNTKLDKIEEPEETKSINLTADEYLKVLQKLKACDASNSGVGH